MLVSLDSSGLTFPAQLPAFSTDSKSLAVIRSEAGKRYLLVVNIETDQRRVTLLP